MPSNIAYPLGGPKRDFRYFYLQMHYNNLNMDKSRLIQIIQISINLTLTYKKFIFKDVQDNSGIRLFVTTRYRPIEFGVLTVNQLLNFFERFSKI